MRIQTHYRPEVVVSKDTERPQLRHPYLDVAEERVVATDGRRMVAVPVVVEEGEVSGHIACDLFKIGRKRAKKDEAEFEVVERQTSGDVTWPPPQALGAFPKWQEIVPSFQPGAAGTITLGLDATLLRGIADALGTSRVAITFRLDSVNANPRDTPSAEPQLLVTRPGSKPDDGDGYGVLMPIMLDADGFVHVEEEKESEGPDADGAIEKEADALLKDAGSGDLNRASLKGDAVASKKAH